MGSYKLDIKTAAGVLQATVTDFNELSCRIAVNEPGYMEVTLDADHPARSYLNQLCQVELWRRDIENDIDWYRHFGGLYSYTELEYEEEGILLMGVPGFMDMLRWRIVAWYANTADRSAFTSEAAETIMKTLVSYNAGSSATTGNGRLRTGTITGISVQSDSAGGNSLDWYCAYDNLLETLKDLAKVAGGDFDLVKTGDQAWEFRFYSGQLGTDRTATVKFSRQLGNLGVFRYIKDANDEATVCLVGGQGEEGDREVEIRTGTNYSASNDKEVFINGSGSETTAGLQDIGDQRLDETMAKETLEYTVLQIPSSAYYKHYYLGDLVTVINPDTGSSDTKKINAVVLSLDQDGVETLDVEMVEV